LLTDKNIFAVMHTQNPEESSSVHTCSNQERRRDKTPAQTIDVQTVSNGISRWVTSDRENNSLIFVLHIAKVIEGCYRHVMLL